MVIDIGAEVRVKPRARSPLQAVVITAGLFSRPARPAGRLD